jgi:hypothetical protein
MLRTSEGGVDADVERFFEECRADPRYRQQPEVIGAMIDAIEERFEKFYLAGDESASWQDIWDRIREVVTRKEPLMERAKALISVLEEMQTRGARG